MLKERQMLSRPLLRMEPSLSTHWHPSRRVARWACLWSALVTVVLCTLPAAAQTANATLTLPNTGVSVERETERGESEFPFYVSRRDCIENAIFRFRLQVKGLTNVKGKVLQTWATDSSDCSLSASKTNGDCGLVAQNSTLSSATEFTVEARARDIVRAYKTPRPTTLADGTPDAEICDSNIENTVVLQFFVMSGTDLVSNIVEYKNTQIDLVGPDAPIEVTAGIGENKLIVEWDVPDGEEATDTQSFAFYCDVSGPPTTQQNEGGATGTGATSGIAGAAGAAGGLGVGSGTGGAGGADDGTAACPPGELQPGKLPTNLKLKCGDARGLTSRSGQAEPLENYVTYAVAVAAVDQVGNSGVLSNVACGRPEPVITFFEAYKDAGGQGGGGYCALGAVPAPGALGAVILAGVTWLVRRRRQRA